MPRQRSSHSSSRIAALPKRARMFLVLTSSLVLVGFVCLPLLYNGYLFAPPTPENVYAAPGTSASLGISTPTPTLVPSSTPAPATTTAPAPEVGVTEISLTYITLQLDDDNEHVSTLQARLMELGYFDFDEITTFFGPVTKSAVELFQRAQGLAQTGIADDETLTLLYGDNPAPYQMRLGDQGSDVRGLQRKLMELGYYSEKDNGYFGVATERAVKSFQKRNALNETGVIDHDGRKLLYSPQARPLIDPTPTPKPSSTPKPSTPKPTTPKPTPKPSTTPSQASPTVRPSNTFEIPYDELFSTPTPAQKSEAPVSTPKRTEDEGSYGSGVSGLIAAAKAQLGKPYVWSDEGPDSFDCSGLVYYALKQAGVSVGRYDSVSYSQLSSWKAITSLSDCKRGDILFYKSDTKDYVNHMGIYLGGGEFIHASSSAGKVMVSTTTGYYDRNFIVARRVF